MKRVGSFLLAAWFIFCCLPVAAAETEETDERTGIQYTITYHTQIGADGYYAFRSEDLYYQDAASLYEKDEDYFYDEGSMKRRAEDTWDGWLSPTDEQVKDAWQDYRDRVEENAVYCHPDRIDTATCYLQDGNTCTVNNGVTAYWRFFDLPLDFKGTRQITKEGVPFSVTGDGKGTLSFKAETDMDGTAMAEFTIPPTYDYIETEVTETSWYEVSYQPKKEKGDKGTYTRSTTECSTLEKALDFCEENADRTEEIAIRAMLAYERTHYVTASYALVLRIVYGNTDQSDATTETYPTPPHPVSKTTTQLPPTTTEAIIPFVPPTTAPPGDIHTDFDEATGTLTVSGTGEVRELYPRCEREDEWPDYLTGVVEENTTVKHVVIEEGITGISNSFQDLNNMETVTFPDSLQKIEMSFMDCDSLTQIELPEPVSLSLFGFNDCDKLEAVHFKGAVSISNEYTGGTFFSNLPALEEIYFPQGSSVDSVCHNCPSLKKVEFEKGAGFYSFDFLDVDGSMLDSFVNCHKNLTVFVWSPSSDYDVGYEHLRIVNRYEMEQFAATYTPWIVGGLLLLLMICVGAVIVWRRKKKSRNS